MTRPHPSLLRRVLAPLVLIALVGAACGSDDTTAGAEGATSAAGGSSDVVTSDGSTTGGPTGEGGGGDHLDVVATENAGRAEPPVTDSLVTDPVTADAVVVDSSCGADDFDLSVNDVVRTDGYPDPELGVTCDGTTTTVTTNNIIAYEFVQITPNDLAAQDLSIDLSAEPQERATPGAMGLGAVAVAVNGMVMFAAFEAPQDGYRDPLLDGLLDFCNGHTAPGGVYHYHARPDCILADPTEPGTVVGYAFDGYEIVVPTACADDACSTTEQVVSSYQKINGDDLGAFTGWEFVEGSGDLDVCNGRTDADGVYRYYATDDFPYLPFCFHGETEVAAGDFDGSEPVGGPPPG